MKKYILLTLLLASNILTACFYNMDCPSGYKCIITGYQRGRSIKQYEKHCVWLGG